MNKSDIPQHINSRQSAKDGGYKYFHGTICKYGHDGFRYVSGHCVQCQIDKMQTEEAKKKKAEYRASEAGKAVTKVYNVKYYHEDRENQINRVKEYQKARPDVALKSKRKHKEKWYAYTREWRKENRHICRIHEEKRRARISGNGGEHTHEQAMAVLEMQNHKCVNCGKALTKQNRHKDHIMPLYLGGTNDIKNIQWLDNTCNLRKHKKDPIVWAQSQGRLL